LGQMKPDHGTNVGILCYRVTIWGSSVICHPTRSDDRWIWSDEQMTDHLTRWSVHPSDQHKIEREAYLSIVHIQKFNIICI